MFYCEKCGNYFATHDAKLIFDKDEGYLPYCPACESDDLLNAATCCICGDPFVSEEAAFSDVCDSCVQAICESFEDWKKTKSTKQLEILDDVFDGEHLYEPAKTTWYGKRIYKEDKNGNSLEKTH